MATAERPVPPALERLAALLSPQGAQQAQPAIQAAQSAQQLSQAQQSGQVQPQPSEAEQINEVLQQLVGGELPGAGVLFPSDPDAARALFSTTTVDEARAALLYATKFHAISSIMPYDMGKISEHADSALKFTQAYLLADPSVDAEGVSVAAKGEAQAAGQMAVAEHGATLKHALVEHEADMQARVAAHASGQSFKRPVTVSGYVEPPKVQPNPAEAAIGEEHKAQEQQLKGARADNPRPQPRV